MRLCVLLDIVPNHLAIDPANAYFEGALREGPSGSHGAMFDVDWHDAGGKIVLTVLEHPLAEELAAGSVAIDRSTVEPIIDRRVGPTRSRHPVPRAATADLPEDRRGESSTPSTTASPTGACGRRSSTTGGSSRSTS